MPRLAGVPLPEDKTVKISLTHIYGIGSKNVAKILKTTKINPDKRAKELTSEEIIKLQKAISTIPTEGVLRKIVLENIKRLKQINSYRGSRHNNRLPARGQRTRSNARTKRGKKLTIGAMKKDALQKKQTAEKEKSK